jgi:hypothetical protein
MPRLTYVHPDQACTILGLIPKEGEGKWAKYDRRKHLKSYGLRRVKGKWKGFRYLLHEVEAANAKQLNRA